MKKKLLALALCFVLALSMAACGSSSSSDSSSDTTAAAEENGTDAAGEDSSSGSDELKAIAVEGMETSITCDPIELSLACSGTVDGTVLGDAVYAAIDAVAEWTDGAVVVNFYPGGQLGGDTELIESEQVGSVDMVQAAPTSQTTLIPELSVLDIGGLYSDIDSANAVVDSFMDRFEEAYANAGIQLMTMYCTDFRLLTSNREINSADDLQGLNIRTQENSYHMTFWSALGCNPTPLAFGEVYLSLQQGLIDAQENPPASIYGVMLYEVQTYLYESNHIPFVNTMTMNKAKYESLSDEQRLAVDQFIEYIERYQMAGTEEDDARMLQEMEDYGMQILSLPEDITPLFAEAADVVIEEMKAEGKIDADFIDDYVAAARAYLE